MRRVAILRSLVNEDRHDRELVVELKQDLFSHKESCRAVYKSARVVNGCAEVAGGPGAILNAKRVISAMPFEPLMAYPECIAIAGRNDRAIRRCATFASSKIKPPGQSTARRLHVIETHVNIAFNV